MSSGRRLNAALLILVPLRPSGGYTTDKNKQIYPWTVVVSGSGREQPRGAVAVLVPHVDDSGVCEPVSGVSS